MRLALIVTIFVTICITASAQTESREQVLRQIEAKRAELSVLEDKLLAPSDEDRSAYAEFLKQPDTGLIRLLPRETYDKENKLTIRGGGAYYSFALLTHAYGRGSDIELEQNRLSVGFAGYDYGLLVKAGNGPPDELTFEHPFVRPLANYKAAETEPDARSEHRRFGAGVNLDGISIGNYLPVEVNSNYARVIFLFFCFFFKGGRKKHSMAVLLFFKT